MKQFKVGDRVAVYSHTPNKGAKREPGKVSDHCEKGSIGIDLDNGGYCIVHPKQCRLLKKKQPKIYYGLLHKDDYIITSYNNEGVAEEVAKGNNLRVVKLKAVK